jgi:hypothetical protein
MFKMKEDQSLPTVNLTGYQKMLLAKIVSAPDSPSGGKKVYLGDEKLVNAREFLTKLGIITFDVQSGTLDLTDRANALMQETGIVNDSGELTDLGKQFAAGEIPNNSQPSSPSTPNGPTDQSINQTDLSGQMSGVPTEKFHISFKNFLRLTESQ